MTTRAIGPIGTVGRVIGGMGLVYLAVAGGPDGWGLAWHEAALGLVGFPAVTILGVLVWKRLGKQLAGPATPISGGGRLGFCAATGVIIVLFVLPITSNAAALFFGSTLLLAAARGYAGCELTAISNWLLRRDDRVGCMVFSPVDAIEAKLTNRPPSV